MLKDLSIEAYLDLLASDAPAPGGGSASALAGAQGAALGAMVTALSIGRKKYLEHTEYLTGARDALTALMAEFMADIDRDTQAFDAVSAAMKLPKDTESQAAARAEVMQQALLGAIAPPMAVCRRCLMALEQIEGLIGRSNTNTASDLGVAASMLRGAAQGAWLNVLINAGSLKDAAKAEALRGEAESVYREALRKADAVFEKIEAGL